MGSSLYHLAVGAFVQIHVHILIAFDLLISSLTFAIHHPRWPFTTLRGLAQPCAALRSFAQTWLGLITWLSREGLMPYDKCLDLVEFKLVHVLLDTSLSWLLVWYW